MHGIEFCTRHCTQLCTGSYPKSVCTSVNECICHGIPDKRPLQDGDIVNIDVTVYLNVRYVLCLLHCHICQPPRPSKSAV